MGDPKKNAVEIILDDVAPKTTPKHVVAPPRPDIAMTVAPMPGPGYIQLDGTNFAAQPSPPNKEFDQGQAVIACSLKGAAHLNGKRGVVQRRDPHPARKGRWEVELRVSDGKVEVVPL